MRRGNNFLGEPDSNNVMDTLDTLDTRGEIGETARRMRPDEKRE
ncbi:MAG: hypothetical protein Q7J78_07225 [Clostridiales bacterium]|nr:hypothetical protein [Clostridiales bacterium]